MVTKWDLKTQTVLFLKMRGWIGVTCGRPSQLPEGTVNAPGGGVRSMGVCTIWSMLLCLLQYEFWLWNEIWAMQYWKYHENIHTLVFLALQKNWNILISVENVEYRTNTLMVNLSFFFASVSELNKYLCGVINRFTWTLEIAQVYPLKSQEWKWIDSFP